MNDDIRAVASSSLLPISGKLVDLISETKIFNSVVLALWASLQELDDITAATSFVMDLLADLVKHPRIANVMRNEATDFFQNLVPRLYPFMRHAVYSVRKAVIRTLMTLTELSEASNNVTWISMDLIRLVFQNFMLEDRREAIDASLELATKLVKLLHHNYVNSSPLLVSTYKTSLSHLFALLMSPVGNPVDTRLLVKFSSAQKGEESGLNISPQDNAMLKQDLTIIEHADIIYGRIAGLTALGRLLSGLINNTELHELRLADVTSAYLSSAWAGHRLFAGIIIEECANCLQGTSLNEASPMRSFLQTMVHTLSETTAGASLLYQELQHPLKALRNEALILRHICNEMGSQLPLIPPMPGDATEVVNSENPWGNIFTIPVADAFMSSIPSLPENDALNMSKGRFVTLISNYKGVQQKWDTQVQMAFASSVVSFGELPLKQNPITRSLMNAIKTEPNEQLQARAGNAVSGLIKINSATPKGRQVNEKIVKNVCVFLCSDAQSVGDIFSQERQGIKTLVKLKLEQEIKKPAKKSEASKKKTQEIEDVDISALSAIDQASKLDADEAQKKAMSILHRG
jgi:TATA-binding protein-associated factor